MNANGNETVGVVRGGKVELKSPAPWPDGAAVRVVLAGAAADAPLAPEIEALIRAEQARADATPSGGMTEAEQVGSPEAIAAWLAEDEARPGMSEEDADDIARIIKEGRTMQARAWLARERGE